MDLNYIAFFLIAFIPLIIAYLWYHPNSFISKKFAIASYENGINFSLGKLIWAFLLSFTLVYGYMNLVIHQMGFYELFFTDIMQGKVESKKVVDDFLSKYGNKHRHFGHGVFHGVINAFVFALPFIGFFALLENKLARFYYLHLGYWLITSAIIGGLIAAFV